jgi:ArsR family transcriptional regulator
MPTPKIDSLFMAFADQTRLRIIHLLLRQELCVCDLMSVLKLPQSKVSRHLAYLRSAGVVKCRNEGLWKHYSLTPPGGRFHKGLIDCLRGCFSDVPVLQRDVKILRQRQKEIRRSCKKRT